jgi:uncharacterized protein (DUF2267 family)
MSMTGLDVFDHAVHTANVWVKEVAADEHIADKSVAWRAICAVLQVLHERIQAQPALMWHLSAQLPLIIRGAFHDQPGDGELAHSPEEFLERVSQRMRTVRPVNAFAVTRAVLSLLNNHLPPGQIDKLRCSLPEKIRALWPEPEVPTPPPGVAHAEHAKPM